MCIIFLVLFMEFYTLKANYFGLSDCTKNSAQMKYEYVCVCVCVCLFCTQTRVQSHVKSFQQAIIFWHPYECEKF